MSGKSTDTSAPAARRRDRRAEIAAAALRCLQRDGYAGLTARAIAAEAQMSLGHLSYHFRDMTEVLSQAYGLASDQLRQAEQDRIGAAPATPQDRLRGFLAAGFTPDFLTPDHVRVRIDLWSAALAHPEVAQTERALYERYRSQLAAHLADLGAAPADRVGMATDAIMAMLDGMWLDWMRRRDDRAVENGLEACLLIARSLSVGALPVGPD